MSSEKIGEFKSNMAGASDCILATLSPEKQERAKALQQAMAERFSLPLQDFGLVRVEEIDTEPKVVVMLAGGDGLRKGSYNNVMDKKSREDFVIEVDGQEIDTREAMVWSVYKAFIGQVKSSGTISRNHHRRKPGTWLTGKPANEHGAYYGRVSPHNEMPFEVEIDRDHDWTDVNVRPVAVV